MAAFLVLLITLALIALLWYYYVTSNNGYFHEKPIPSLAAWPLLGSSGALWLKRCTFPQFVQSMYDKFPGVKVFGMFDGTMPFFVIRDPELIKRVAVKDFEYFVDHRPVFGSDIADESKKGLLARSLFAKTGHRWKEMRATLSPAFTGSKMRQMLGLMVECCETMVQVYEQNAKSNEGSVEIELKDVTSKLGVDIIASCAFGLKVNSFEDGQNEFLRQGQKMVSFSRPGAVVKMIAFRLFPKLLCSLGIDLVDREQTEYFTALIRETVETRESRGIMRNDLIDILLQAKRGALKYQSEKEEFEGFATVQESEVGKTKGLTTMSESEMVAQCFGFFFGGFDTVSTNVMFVVYELILNMDIQQKLYEEIMRTNEALNGERLTYDVLQRMHYMDMVISETLRMWPLASVVDRLCVKDYELDCGDGLKFTVDKGTCLWFPVHGLHHDPKYYPQPEKFDPERFSDENKRNINLGSYLPFGIGPRSCIASRFALMEVKAIVYYMLLKFSFERSANTQIPLQLKKGVANMVTERGVHVLLRVRDAV